MSLLSMTGFARGQGAAGAYHWAWEVRTVNGRNLDIRTRVPAGYEMLEPGIRKLVQERLQRGSVNISLQVRRSGAQQTLSINHEALQQLLDLAQDIEQRHALRAASVDGILGLKGVVEVSEPEDSEEELEVRNDALLANLGEVLGDLVASRRQEGHELEKILLRTLAEMRKLAAQAADTAALQPVNIKARLQAKLDELVGEQPGLSEERLAQEVALMATKADVREELDRLSTHIEAAQGLIGNGGTVGRRMDFLAQELNREANTLCSKSADTALTAIGLDLKTLIDQLREQVQNLE